MLRHEPASTPFPDTATSPLLQTERLRLRELDEHDAGFMLELLNEPGWIRFIGDRGLRTEEAARDYLRRGPMKMYRERGFGLWCVELRPTGTPVGICGLIKRDSLDDVDIGFAFLARHERHGYGVESARAVMAHAREALGLQRIVAITSVDNHGSIRLLEKIGLRFEKMVTMPGDDEEIKLFATV
jgi:RimJ/RimL family protein N-acetyltransferase